MDEAQTGVGRLGKWWGYEHYDSRPDTLWRQRRLVGGAPLSAVLTGNENCRRSLGARLQAEFVAHGRPAVGCRWPSDAGGHRRKRIFFQNVTEMGQYLKDRLEALGRESAVIGEIRGHRLLNGIEFVRSERGESNEEATELFLRRMPSTGPADWMVESTLPCAKHRSV